MQFISRNSKIAAAIGVGISSYFLIRKWAAGGVNKLKPDLTGKCVLLTGGNAGIGKEAAREFAKLNARVIVTVRDDIKGKQTVNDLKASSKNNNVEYMLLDFSSLENIRNFVQEFKQKNTKIDILVNNAGVMEKSHKKTQDGFELHFGVNHLAPFLLTNLFISNNLINEGGRIVVVASRAHRRGLINFDDIQAEKSFSTQTAYSQSKLANVLYARELARRLKAQNKNITVVSLHPGVVRSDLWRNVVPSALQWAASPLMNLLLKSNLEGAQTTLTAALSPNVESGSYWSDCKQIQADPVGTDDEVARRLWELSEKLVGAKL